MCISEFVLGKARAALHDQAARIYKPVAQTRGGLGCASRHHGRDYEVGDPGRSLARAEKKQLLVGQLTAGNAQCREQTGEHYRSRSLNIVIENANLVAIFVQKMECRMIGKIFELNQNAGKYSACSRDKFVDKLVICRTTEPLLAQANIIRVVQQRLIVSTDIQHHWQTELRMHAGTCRVEGEFADRNAHAVGAEVTEAEDALAVGYDDKLSGIGPIA